MQGIGEKLVSGYVDYKVTWPAKIQEQQIQRLGDLGYYAEGQPGFLGAAPGQPAGFGLPASVLLLGGAVLLFVLLKD